MGVTVFHSHSHPTEVHETSDDKLPWHWLLAKMGKRVLRPGGLRLTHQLLTALDIQPTDEVVEFAPGLGVTARLVLARNPVNYTAVERDAAAAASVRRSRPRRPRCS